MSDETRHSPTTPLTDTQPIHRSGRCPGYGCDACTEFAERMAAHEEALAWNAIIDRARLRSPPSDGARDAEIERLKASAESARRVVADLGAAIGEHAEWQYDRVFGAVQGRDVYDPSKFVDALDAARAFLAGERGEVRDGE